MKTSKLAILAISAWCLACGFCAGWMGCLLYTFWRGMQP